MKKSTRKALTPEVVDAEPEDLALVRVDGTAVTAFLAQLPVFFKRAGVLEAMAQERLTQAKTLATPTDRDDDAWMQSFIQQTTAEKKTVETHWSICQIVNAIHRRLTAARNRATTALEEANVIANRLHTGYVQAERRRAAEEQERLRREAEARAQAERDAEIARLKTFVRKGQAAKEAVQEQIAALKEQPLDVDVETVTPNIATGAGYDRTTWSAEVLNETALVEAVIRGVQNIPHDVLTVNHAKLTEYARALHERLNVWPGVRAVKKTRFI